MRLDRRHLLRATAATAAAPLLAGCDRIAADPAMRRVLAQTEHLTKWAQRLIAPRAALAREFTEADITQAFRPNGTTNPDDDEYQDMAAGGFADWRLQVDGLVEQPGKFSLSDLRAMPARTQITRHDCVEGWSCIAKWTGVPLAAVLDAARPTAEAAFVVFHCADPVDFDGGRGETYYESLDLDEARHPQTILAYDMNGAKLPVRHGAPLRLRAERQLGYKMAKYLMRLELVASFAGIGGGKGGSWEDRGYTWYAGI